MSMVQLLQTNAQAATARPRPRVRLLPYLLSLPALLVCVAILVPFVTAAVYSLQRYRLNLPYLRGFIGAGNYIDFLSDPAFWNTLRISITYTAVTVVVALLLGLGIALLLRRPRRRDHARREHACRLAARRGRPRPRGRSAPGQSWPYSFSPDGRRIAFSGQRAGVWNVYWTPVEGGEERRVTDYQSPALYVRHPEWSPRGDRIAYEFAESKSTVWIKDLHAPGSP